MMKYLDENFDKENLNIKSDWEFNNSGEFEYNFRDNTQFLK